MKLIAKRKALYGGAGAMASSIEAQVIREYPQLLDKPLDTAEVGFCVVGTAEVGEGLDAFEASGVGRSATLVVAASDSGTKSKTQADYECDGTADEVQINLAIAALPTIGGKVVLLEGTYNIAAPIIINRNQVSLWGQGAGNSTYSNTRIELSADSDCNILEIEKDSGASQVIGADLQDFFLDGNKASQASGHGIYGDYVSDVYITKVGVRDCKENGIMFAATDGDGRNWHIFLDRVFSNANDGNGLDTYKTEFRASDSFFEENDIGFRGRAGKSGVRHFNHCHFESNTTHGIHSQDELLMTGCAAGDVYLDCSTASLIDNSISTATADYAMVVLGSGEGSRRRVEIVGNRIHSTNDGIHLASAYGVTIADNDIDITGTWIVYSGDDVNSGNNRIYERYSDLFMDVLAVSATHVRSNEDLSASVPITFTLDAQPDVPRTLSGHFDAHANITAYTIEVVGVTAKGNTITETLTEADGWDWETNDAFATITSIKMTARTGTGSGDTMDIGITDVLGLSNIIYETSDVYKIKKNNANAVVAAAQVNVTYHTYDMSVITLGAADDFTIWFRSNLNILS